MFLVIGTLKLQNELNKHIVQSEVVLPVFFFILCIFSYITLF